MPIKVFICYAHKDETLLTELKTHLIPLRREGLIDFWYDRDISAGTKWEQQIKEQLNAAQIILLLISPDFMASDYINNVELKRALERDQRGEARVIPVILRHAYWQIPTLRNLQALPTDAKPIKSWSDPDEAFVNVTEGIRKVVIQLSTHPVVVSSAVSDERQQEMTIPNVQYRSNVYPTLSLLAVAKLELVYTLTNRDAHIFERVALSADGQTLVSGGIGNRGNRVHVWNLATGQVENSFEGYFSTVALSADGQILVYGDGDKTIQVWNLATGQVVHTFEDGSNHVALSADGQILVTLESKTIKVRNLITGQVVRSHIDYKHYLGGFSLSADGKTLAISDADGTLQVWNLATGHVVRTLTGSFECKAISADGHILISTHGRTISIWNLATGQEVRTLTGHTETVLGVALSIDGQTLASGSHDNTIKLWKLANGEQVRTLTGHKGYVSAVALSADGQTLVSGSGDGTIKVWRA